MDGDKTCIAIFNNYLGPIRLGAQTSSAVESAGLGAAVATTSMDTPTTLQVVEYYHLDAVGSVRAVTDADGTVIARHDFRPFGEELSPQIPPHDRKLFTGQERDFETGLDYFYARQLRVDLGRFTTPDPLTDLAWTDSTLGATNPYGYVNNNPLRYVDPTGMTPGLVHVNCTGVEACAQMMSQWTSANNNGWCTAADGGGLDCGVGYIVQVSPSAAPVTSSVSQPLTPMGAGVLSFYPGRGPSAGTGVGGGGGENGANNGTPSVSHCLWVAAKAKGLAMGLDAIGSVPLLGNTVSASAGAVRAAIALDHVIASHPVALVSAGYGAIEAITAGAENPADSLVGAASSSASVGLTLADMGLGGAKIIPGLGNAISVLTLGWDSAQAYGIYQSCMAGHQ
jgi:RHS repeat-associated protein